ncbi:unnamed protein product [Clavelina lepadiformis]|uniref:DOMON domain-containing protein n=1 Tax=Clavelina lepadiformis TaxID=159417 RepID=A0ABP0FMG6_CLALP
MHPLKLLLAPLILIVGFSCTGAVDGNECGISKHCVKNPPGCDLTDPKCQFFSYAWDAGTRTFNMELRGGAGGGTEYVAVAFGTVNRMQDADLYFCTGTTLRSGVIQRFRRPPRIFRALPRGITNVMASTNNGVAECSFTRTAVIRKPTSQNNRELFDLFNTKYHILQATGRLAAGIFPRYHGSGNNRGISNEKINLALPVIPPPMIPDCDVTNGLCNVGPVGCEPGDSNCLFATWNYNSGLNNFEITFGGNVGAGDKYVAMAFSPNGLMENSDLYYCTGSELKSGRIVQRRRRPITDDDLPAGIKNEEASNANDVIMCSFTRAASVTKEDIGTFDLKMTDYHLLLASGRAVGDRITYHGPRRHSSSEPLQFAPPPPVTPMMPDCDVTNNLCYAGPMGCEPGNSNCLFSTWSFNSELNNFVISFGGNVGAGDKYVAMAFSPNGLMENSDLYYCTGSELKSGRIVQRHITPIVEDTLPTGVTNEDASNADGVIMCSFTRAASVTKEDIGTFDLAMTDYHILLATGGTAGATFLSHIASNRHSSPAAFSFTPAEAMQMMPDCDVTNSLCYAGPMGCEPGNSNCLFATWSFNSELNNFEITFGGNVGAGDKYVAMAFSPNGLMENSDLYYCTGSELKSGRIVQRHITPIVDDTLPAGITNEDASNADGVIMCSFTRAASVTKEEIGTFDLTMTDYHILLATGGTAGKLISLVEVELVSLQPHISENIALEITIHV